MSEFEVVPVSLEAGGSKLGASGAAIAEARAQLESTSSACAAMGGGEASSAYSAMLCTWGPELGRMADEADRTGRSTIHAARLYEAVDSALFAGVDAGGGDGG